MSKSLLSLFLLSLISIACGDVQLSPISPSNSGSFSDKDNSAVQDAVLNWSPNVGVHATGEALGAYRDSLSKLKRAGKLNGVRAEININDNGPNPVIKMMGVDLGLEILGLIDNHFLFDPNIERRIYEIFNEWYPEIHYFQIGNETTTILRKPGPTLNIEKYMEVFKRIYNHVQNRYPNKVLITQSTLGSGIYGPTELEKMVDLGLAEMDPNKVIIGINSYDPANATQYFGVINGPLSGYRVWITETGVKDPNRHISYVAANYKTLRNYLRAERIYWYVMWGGDGPPDTDFSLIKNPGSYPNYWKSPLFKALTGE